MIIKPFDGGIIREPGIYSDVPIETYHGNPFLCDGFSISSSGLRDFIKRPSLYWAYSSYNRNNFDKGDKSYFEFGKAAHIHILEPELFDKEVAIKPDTYLNDKNEKKDWSGNAKYCRQWIADRKSEGRTVINSEEMESILQIEKSLKKNYHVEGGILDGLAELTMVARFGNIWLRARPDKLPSGGNGDFADVKTAASVSENDRYWANRKSGYYIQAAICRMVSQAVMGPDWEFGGYALVWCEKSPPYDVVLDQIDESDISKGEELVRAALGYLNKCIDQNQWPGENGFGQHMETLSIGAAAKTSIDLQIANMKQELAA